MMTGDDRYRFCFFFSSRRRHTRLQGDWSSDVCSSDLREHAERIVSRHQGRADHARPFGLGRTEPGSGWHGLPRRVKPERPKEVAKIVDLLGAGEKFPQHHGTPGSEGAKIGRAHV